MSITKTSTGMGFGPLGKTVYDRTYSRPVERPEGQEWKGSHESWEETVERVVEGNAALSPLPVSEEEKDALKTAMIDFKIIPAGRHLWSSGTRDSRGLYNCWRAGWGSLEDHFTFMFDQLMLGGGVGSNYSQEYLSYPITSKVSLTLNLREFHPDYTGEFPSKFFYSNMHVVEDSREGWVEALRLIIQEHTRTDVEWVRLDFDFSNVREKGQPIHGFGGTASGPVPLMRMLFTVNEILNNLYGGEMTPLDAMRIDHEIASCVVAGNVRRSARMSMLHWEDPSVMDFIRCKDNPMWHWTTNISVEIDNRFVKLVRLSEPPREDGADWAHAHDVYEAVTKRMHEHGEPGFYNSEVAGRDEPGDVRCTNPCGEIPLEEWEACNLGHVNLAAFSNPSRDFNEIRECFRLMTRFLMRATFAPVQDERSRKVMDLNRRIGVGILGYHEWLINYELSYSVASYSPTIMQSLLMFKEQVNLEAVSYAKELHIPVPIKTTTVAPTGTISNLPGVTSGIQPLFAKYFIRRIRYADNATGSVNDMDPSFLGFQKDIYSANTEVASFLSKDSMLERVHATHLVEDTYEITLEQQLGTQAMVQKYYANNAISYTVNFDPEHLSLGTLRTVLINYLDKVKGTTVFPLMSRPLSPIERISKERYHIDHFSVSSNEMQCSTGACPIK